MPASMERYESWPWRGSSFLKDAAVRHMISLDEFKSLKNLPPLVEDSTCSALSESPFPNGQNCAMLSSCSRNARDLVIVPTHVTAQMARPFVWKRFAQQAVNACYSTGSIKSRVALALFASIKSRVAELELSSMFSTTRSTRRWSSSSSVAGC